MERSLLLYPGLLNDKRIWREQEEALSREAKIEHGEAWNDSSLESAVSRILDSGVLSNRFAVCGFSMGGFLALETWRQASERVSGIALLNSSARADSDTDKEKRKMKMREAYAGKFSGITRRTMGSLVHSDNLGNMEIESVVREMALDLGREIFIRSQEQIMARSDSRDMLGEIDVPALVVGGVDDKLTPVELQHELAGGLSNGELHILERCGHLTLLESSEEVSGLLLGWLGKLL